jgi:hypothetical protein
MTPEEPRPMTVMCGDCGAVIRPGSQIVTHSWCRGCLAEKLGPLYRAEDWQEVAA